MSKPRVLFDLFDVERGEKLRDEGMKSAAEHRKELLNIAKIHALRMAEARPYAEITIDDVIESLEHSPIGNRWQELGNALGSVFKGPDFEFTGNWVPSRRTSNHRRYIRSWRLKR